MRKNLYMMVVITGVALAVTACGPGRTAETGSDAAMQKESTVETGAKESVSADGEAAAKSGTKEETNDVKETREVKESKERGEGLEMTEKSSSLEHMASMIGMSDEEAKTLLGGGTENWSADRTILIGRTYDTELFGKTAAIHTMYDDENLVYLVQAELPNMSASESQKQITEATGVAMEQVDKGESGQGSGQWIWDGMMVNLYQSGESSVIELFVPVQ